MLIIGAKGFAKEVLETFYHKNDLENVVFYDDITLNAPDFLFEKFKIFHSKEEAQEYFQTTDSSFTIGIGKPILRKQIKDTFEALGGSLSSTISPLAQIGNFDVSIGAGSNILQGAIISNGARLGKGCIVYYNVIVTHDVLIGDFVEISPNATLLGRCEIGSFSHIGSGAVILPDVSIGKNVVVAAGSIVTKNVPDNCMVAGNPASFKKEIAPLDFYYEG
ncbi:MAG TPA: acetyltransferase [Flavobacterium sp.]|uniref:acetyltransferase n=1 Tax=Flavobacterium sp. TaxID=239 RepID=UPI002ECFEF60